MDQGGTAFPPARDLRSKLLVVVLRYRDGRMTLSLFRFSDGEGCREWKSEQ